MDFFGRVEALQTAITASRAAVTKRAQWQERGTFYMRRYGKRSGEWIEVDPSVQRMFLARLSAAAPAVADAYNRHLIPAAIKAQDEWPVLTGISRASIALEFERIGPTTMVGRLRVMAPYAWFINKGADAKRLIFDPGPGIAEAMARDIGEDLS